ncbi:TIGR03773 family transporter-associated surface protein [Micromonospora deserti]|uniref:Cell wall anchor protein n=1 Tax=Micromonospora deserti TaxID=2070366 RepID=A0A2W2CQL9_9ACTN|nr:TIGR03773 family transporter-associated surface protein [Micromonospora deserti]PZG01756.1 cell wall anchor protein [Micromonospora deserti]
MKIRGIRAGAAGLALGVLTLLTGPTPATAAAAGVRAAGADLVSVSLHDGVLALRIRDAVQANLGLPGHDPEDVVVDAGGGSAGRVPGGKAFAFLGEPGHPVWSLTGGDAGFPGLDATGVRPGATAGDAVDVSLRSVDGPGRFTAYTLSPLGVPTLLFGSGRGAPRALRLPAAVRTGPTVWMFDAPGEHHVTLAASVVLPSGKTLSTERTYRVRVPAIDPSPAAPLPAPAVAATGPPAPTELRVPVPQPRPAAAPQVLAAPAAPANAVPAAARTGERKVISDGHLDMGPQLTGDTFTIRIKDDTVSPAVWRETSDVVLQVKDNAKITVPAGADFLGAQGDTVWLLPQSQQAGIIWPGWNTQHESVVSGTRGSVTWTLRKVTGPGRFALFLTGSFGKPDMLFDSARAFPQQLSIPPNTHAHGNWAFSKPGLYRLAVQMSGTTTAGAAVSDTKTLTIAVGDGTDPGSGFGGGSIDSGGAGDGGGAGPLPRTGAGWVLSAVGVGGVLVAAGALLVVVTRRRRAAAGASGTDVS